MYRVTFVCTALRKPWISSLVPSTLEILVEAAVQANIRLLQYRPELQQINKVSLSSIGSDSWRDAAYLATHGEGDVLDLVCYRLAQMRLVEKLPLASPRLAINSANKTFTIAFEHKPWHFGGQLPAENVVKLPATITFVSSLFSRNQEDRACSDNTLQIYLEALTRINESLLRRQTTLPNLFDSGVRYEMEPLGQENWQDLCSVLDAKGVGDCEDLGTWRAAELRVRHNIPARAVPRFQITAGGLQVYHILTRYPKPRFPWKPPAHTIQLSSGELLEDPSKVLGMGGAY